MSSIFPTVQLSAGPPVEKGRGHTDPKRDLRSRSNCTFPEGTEVPDRWPGLHQTFSTAFLGPSGQPVPFGGRGQGSSLSPLSLRNSGRLWTSSSTYFLILNILIIPLDSRHTELENS